MFEGKEIRGLEQNPQTKSRWAQLARSGKKVMQFLSEGYVANVVDGKVTRSMVGTARHAKTTCEHALLACSDRSSQGGYAFSPVGQSIPLRL